MRDFSGAQIALIKDDELLVIQRDNKPGLRYAGMWDFPGGGREGTETPFACVAREVREELGLALSPKTVAWQKTYPAMHDPSLAAYFMIAAITDDDVRSVTFGDEGQRWKMMKLADFLADANAVEPLKQRLKDYLRTLSKQNLCLSLSGDMFVN